MKNWKETQKPAKSLLSTEEIIQLLSKELNLKLESRGKDYFGLCPFHKEKTSSFAFEPEKKIFKCFGCGFSAGNIFKFWAEYKKITLAQAKQEIGRLGYYVAWEEASKEENQENDTLFLVNNIYQHNLFSVLGKEILKYLQEERGLDFSSIITFHLGCTTNYKQLTNLFSSQDEKKSRELLSFGLLRISNNSQVYDFFPAKQLIFPLQDEDGKIVAFASRKLVTWQENKYHYLPNYEGYQKSSFLYNYLSVKQASELNYCYLVEGFFDVISLSKAGIKNCLALLGTSISREQIELLKKLSKKVILFLDGDLAGKQATIKIVIALLAQDIECEVIYHEYDYDPDEICRFKADELTKICQKKEDPYVFVLQYFAQNWEIRENPQSVTHFIQKVAEIFRELPTRSQRFLIEKICQITNWNKEEVEEVYFVKPWKKGNETTSSIDEKEKYLIYYCLQSRYYWLIIQEKNHFFTIKENRFIYRHIHNFYLNGFHQKFNNRELNFQKEGTILNKKIEKIAASFVNHSSSLTNLVKFLEKNENAE